jgi:hypothetical protein
MRLVLIIPTIGRKSCAKRDARVLRSTWLESTSIGAAVCAERLLAPLISCGPRRT